jgi:hypothetical protein
MSRCKGKFFVPIFLTFLKYLSEHMLLCAKLNFSVFSYYTINLLLHHLSCFAQLKLIQNFLILQQYCSRVPSGGQLFILYIRLFREKQTSSFCLLIVQTKSWPLAGLRAKSGQHKRKINLTTISNRCGKVTSTSTF